jgi:long-chain fatty acid transport protein
MKATVRIIPLVVLALAMAPAALATNGYFVHGQGTTSKAMAGATTAVAQEALDADTNPAAVAFVPRGYSASVAIFSPDRQYTINGNPSGMPQTFGLTPGTVSSESKYFPMPSIGMNFRPSDVSAVAVNLTAHGGMNTNYRTSTFYGYNRTGVDLNQLFLTGTYARKLTDKHALGISAVAAGQRFKATGLEAFGQFSSDAASLTGNGYDMSYGLGVRVGYLGQILPKLSFGASYTPQISMSEFEDYRGLFAEEGGFDIPATANVGLAWRATDALTITTDYQKIHYNDVPSVGNALLPALMTAPLGSEGGAGFGWQDIDVYKLGLQWKASDVWTWRAGYSKTDQPIPSSEVLFNILAPGVIEEHYTAGFSRSGFNFAVMYAPSKSVIGPNPLEMPGQQSIELEMNEWEIEFGYSWGF